MIFKNIYFWVLTAVLLVVVGFSGLRVLPPMLASYQENKQNVTDTKSELDKQKKLLAAVNAVRENQTELEQLNEKARLLLPTTPQSELLLLQIDEMLNDVNLPRAGVNVPINPKAEEGEATNFVEATITGEISYGQTINLLRRLKVFSRWNKIQSFNITLTGEKYATTIIFNNYFKTGSPSQFSGNQDVIDRAKELFAKYGDFSDIPDSDTEGDFGKDNPFN